MSYVVSVGIGEKKKLKKKERAERDRINILLHGEKPDIQYYPNHANFYLLTEKLTWQQKQRLITLAIHVLENELDTLERI